MGCPTGKISHIHESMAQQELIRIWVKYGDGPDRPNGYYRCDICGDFHLTSKSRDTTFIESNETQNRIKAGRMARDWGDEF